MSKTFMEMKVKLYLLHSQSVRVETYLKQAAYSKSNDVIRNLIFCHSIIFNGC